MKDGVHLNNTQSQASTADEAPSAQPYVGCRKWGLLRLIRRLPNIHYTERQHMMCRLENGEEQWLEGRLRSMFTSTFDTQLKEAMRNFVADSMPARMRQRDRLATITSVLPRFWLDGEITPFHPLPDYVLEAQSEYNRRRWAPPKKKGTAMASAILLLALHLDIGRLPIDQVLPTSIQRLNQITTEARLDVAELLLDLSAYRSWPTSEQPQWNTRRDEVDTALRVSQLTSKSRRNGKLQFVRAFEHVFSQIPQTAFTVGRLTFCATDPQRPVHEQDLDTNGLGRMSLLRPRKEMDYQDRTSVSFVLDHTFRSALPYLGQCRNPTCKNALYQRLVILDRPPLRLLFTLSSEDSTEAILGPSVEPITLQYLNPEWKERQAIYKVCANLHESQGRWQVTFIDHAEGYKESYISGWDDSLKDKEVDYLGSLSDAARIYKQIMKRRIVVRVYELERINRVNRHSFR